jgi:hypothetical protein
VSDLCPDAANQLSERLGGFACDGPAGIVIRSPAGLSNWTLPVLEVVMVIGAVLAIGCAVQRLRRHGDPTQLALVIGALVYVLVVEIPLYFPATFGVEDQIGTIFVHNVFTVEFLHDRLPLYIAALYVALPMLAYEIVRSLGVFANRGPALGALCVGVVHSAFYEVFDQLGPQLRWWTWNTVNQNNHPFLDAVPMTSITLFSLVAPIGLAYLVRRLITPGLRPAGLVLRAVVIGALVPLAMTIGALPATVFGDHAAARAMVLASEFALAWLVAVPVLVACWRSPGDAEAPSRYAGIFGPFYLVTMAVLWLTALPDFLDAVDGTGPDGTPVGNLPFAAACFTACLLALGATIRERMLADGTQGLGRIAADR